MTALSTADFHFDLPEHLIAQRPSPTRGESRLMSVSMRGDVHFEPFSKIVDAFRGDEVLVLNDTKVVPARLYGHKETGGRVEVFFLEPLGSNQFSAMTRGKVRPGHTVHLPLGARATMISRDPYGQATFSLDLTATPEVEVLDPSSDHQRDIDKIWTWLEAAGQLPLPPYIQRQPDERDLDRYQTVYAQSPGAVAAPTAGLHLTDPLLDALRAKGVEICSVTLHVGPGTFLPVKVDVLSDHVMHSERYRVPLNTQRLIEAGRPVVAVGTTVVRALESFAHDPKATRTEIFIYPGYTFRVVDGLLTNFHLPQSTLLMLVSAFAGHERALYAYRQAVEAEMMFYSYGDASLFRNMEGCWR